MTPGAPLPLTRDGSGRFLPWLIAIMACLAALSIAAAGLIGSYLERWNEGLAGALTAELPKPADGALPAATLDAALAAIRQAPGVAAAEPLDDKATEKLLEPWLGDAISSLGLALPVVIDVRLAPGRDIDRPALERRLAELVPGATVERRGAWLDTLLRLAGLVQIGLWAAACLVGLAAVLAVSFVTRTGLALHADLIDLLHVMGASDAYVARQFERHAFRLGLGGGMIGLVAAFLVVGGLRLAGEAGFGATGLVTIHGVAVPVAAAATVLALPILTAAVAWATARVTVLSSLARLP